jgi:hypothetical protein
MPAGMTAAWERTSTGDGVVAVGGTASFGGGSVTHEQARTQAAIPWLRNNTRPMLRLLVVLSALQRNRS